MHGEYSELVLSDVRVALLSPKLKLKIIIHNEIIWRIYHEQTLL